MKLRIVCMLALMAVPGSLAAQTQCVASPEPCSTAVGALQIIININSVFELDLDPSSTALATPTTAVFAAGFAATDGPIARIRSNAPWALLISAVSPTWTGVSAGAETARPDKPASDLSWSTSAAGTFTDLSISPVQVASGLRTIGSETSLFYRTRYQWALDTPGTYSLRILFTIAAP